MNPFKYWLVIKDDSKRTFEICGQTANTNAFENQIHAMQRSGMNISGVTPPVTGKTSSKELVTITNYTKEVGLYDRLQKQHLAITMKAASFDDMLPE
jgi:hypothetical protein